MTTTARIRATNYIKLYRQFFQWLGLPHETRPYRDLAFALRDGLLTLEEGERIEQGRQVWQGDIANGTV